MSNQGLRSLIDNNDDEQTAKSFIKKLKEVGCFACKPCNGTESVGFFKLSYNNGSFFINEKEVSEKEIESTILQRKNYIYTEYLEAGGNLGLIFPKIHTIRMMILNTDGAHPFLMPVCYIRFGSNSTGEANYVRNGDKLDEDFTIFADVNVENGSFSNAKAFYLNRMIEIKKHPDSSMELEGIIPNWDRLRETALGVSKLLFGVEWIGLDMCIDKDCNPRLMEINTQPGIGYLQVYHPLMAIPEVNEYITEKLKRIEEMDSLRKKERNRIAR